MHKSVEHVLLRLLTPAVLLFLAAHLAAGVLDSRGGREQPPGDRAQALYLESTSGAVRVTRPSRAQLRKPRMLEQQPPNPKPRFLAAAAAYISALLAAEQPQERPAQAAHQVPVPSLFARARTRNPRDPPPLSQL